MDHDKQLAERLRKLHAEGVLNDAELKAELRRSTLASRAHPTSLFRLSAVSRWSLAGSAAFALAIGAFFFGKASTVGAGASDESQDGPLTSSAGTLFGVQSADPWGYTSQTDSMTDVTVDKANATFTDGDYQIQVAAACTAAGQISYTISTFDADDQPAPMRAQIYGPSVIGAPAGSNASYSPTITPARQVVPFEMRADEAPAQEFSVTKPEYNNQVSVTSSPVRIYANQIIDDGAEQIAAATQIRVRLHLQSGDAEVAWPQGSQSFRKLMSGCLAAREAERSRLLSGGA